MKIKTLARAECEITTRRPTRGRPGGYDFRFEVRKGRDKVIPGELLILQIKN